MDEVKKTYTVALAGNPNVGKSTIFNSLTGMHQHTGNWPGKTVANATGKTVIGNKEISFVDIPGTYSIMSNSEEEEIARDYICFENPDAIVVVVDATCLERNLNLVFQIMEMTPNVILCVNLLDEAKKKKIKIDFEKLSNLLGIPVVGTIAKRKKTLENLKKIVLQVCEGKIIPKPKKVIYENCIENAILDIQKDLTEISQGIKIDEKNRETRGEIQTCYNNDFLRWVSIKLIDGEEKILNSIEKYTKLNIGNTQITEKVKKVRKDLEKYKIYQREFKDKVVANILKRSENICRNVCIFEKEDYSSSDRKLDKILTSKKWGIPIMILFLGVIFWLTIVGSNYPSEILFSFFAWGQEKLLNLVTWLHFPQWVSDMLVYGIYQTLTWVVSVMLPPMAIFFPLFTFLEDLGYLPRIAFNMDKFFKKACCSGKQMITMCMGFGCNACGVTGCRIIDSPRERLIAILTNNLVPCNGRFPFLITIATIFIAKAYSKYASILATVIVIGIIIFGIILTLIISKVLSKTILKGMPSSFVLELPPYRKPQVSKILIRSILDRTLYVLARAIKVTLPAGLVIWILANVMVQEQSLLSFVANFFDPFAKIMGLDGYILTAFILGIPANEIVLPIMLMCYLKANFLMDIEDTFTIGEILKQNGWTLLTAINVMLFTVFHFPCATTLLTIKKETGSVKWTIVSFLIPTICGIVVCIFTNWIWQLIT